MASSELNVGNIDGVEILTPLKDQCLPPLSNTPMDFSLLTTSQLGISPQSFTPSSGRKDKSRLAQLKLKRRSNVGVRGSPETNSLIRYIAQQRMMKTPPATTESVSARPFTPRVSKLKQEMAIFQSLLCEEEEEMPEKKPRQENPFAECIKTRKDQSDGRSRDAWKENCPPPVTPLPNKRWCPGLCEGEIREANAPTLQHSLQKTGEDSVEQDRAQPQPGAEVPVSPSPPQPPPAHSPAKEQQDSFPEAGARPGDGGPPLPPLFCMPSSPEPNRKDGDPSAHSAVRKKRVRFGAPLSPEFFDKNLPPSTPLQKGATPARAPPPSAGGSQVRSALKTPQRSQSSSAPPQLDFSSPSGASPPLRRGPRGAGADTPEEIAFTMDDSERSLVDETDVSWETQPLDLNAAFREVLFTDVFRVDPPSELESDSNPARNPVLGPEPADVDAPASVPVLGPEPQDVGAPASVPVLGPEPQDVGAPASVPVLGPEPQDVGAPASVPVLGPEPQDVGAPASVPVLGPEPQDVGAPASVPVLGPEPADVDAPASVPVLGPEPQDVGAPASVPVLGPEPQDVGAPASVPVLGPEPQDVGAPASVPVLGPEPQDVGAPASVPVLGPEPQDVGAPASVPVLGPEPQDVGAPASVPVLGPEPQDVGAPASVPVLGPEPQDVGAPASVPATSNSRKRKQPEEVEPAMKRSTRSAAKSAGVKMKKASARRGWGCKEVDRTLYGSRAYASRDPALSPITETLASASRSPTPQRPRANTHTANTQESDSSPALSDLVMAAKLWRERFGASTNESAAGAPVTYDGEPEPPAPSGAFSTRRTPRRGSGPRTETPGRGRGRKVSVPADHWLSEVPEDQSERHSEQPCGDQTAALEDARSSPPSRTPAQDSPAPSPPSETTDQEADSEQAQASLVTERPSQRRFKAARGRPRGRKRSRLPPSTQQHTAQPGEPQPGEPQPGEPQPGEAQPGEAQPREAQPGEGTEGQGRPHGASQEEDDPHSSEGCASDGPEPSLPAWHQLEFSIEDVLRPRASRGQRSVRRSLRNHRSQEAGVVDGGLAWVPHTSPDSLRAVRRKTRGRRGSVILLQPPRPQELEPGMREEPEAAL